MYIYIYSEPNSSNQRAPGPTTCSIPETLGSCIRRTTATHKQTWYAKEQINLSANMCKQTVFTIVSVKQSYNMTICAKLPQVDTVPPCLVLAASVSHDGIGIGIRACCECRFFLFKRSCRFAALAAWLRGRAVAEKRVHAHFTESIR